MLFSLLICSLLFCLGVAAAQDPCEVNPCQNGGTCTGLMASSQCLCPPEYTGMVCETSTEVLICSTEAAAGVLWNSAPVGAPPLRVPCETVDKRFKGLGEVMRECQDNGVWSDLDFTACTLAESTGAFLLIWVTVEADSPELVREATPELETELSTALNQMETATVSMVIEVSPSAVAVAFRVDSPSLVTTVMVSQFLEMETFGEFAVLNEGRDAQGFILSDSCPCLQPDTLFQELCLERNLVGPCMCDSQDCQCVGPFYVGDGVWCTADSDGDRFPDVPLDTCGDLVGSEVLPNYCQEDVCPHIYNPEQGSLDCDPNPPEDFDGCVFADDPFWDITWANTPIGETDVQRCPSGEGLAYRFCGPFGWEVSDVRECDSNDFGNARGEFDSVIGGGGMMNLQDQLEETSEITGDIFDLTMPQQGQSLLPVDLNSTNQIIMGVVGLLEGSLDPNENVTSVPDQNLLGIFSNVLDSNNVIGWATLQEEAVGSQLLLDNAERYGLYLANALGDEEAKSVWRSDNLVIGFGRNDPSRAESSTFPESLDDLNGTFDGIPAQITVPFDFLQERLGGQDSTVPVTNMIFRNMEAVLPVTNSTGNFTAVASMILSTQVFSREPKGKQSDVLLTNPIELSFTFDEVENATDYRCVSWSFSDPIGSGGWVFDGMTTMGYSTSEGKTVVDCQSTHLTSFAVLVDVSGTLSDEEDTELEALKYVSYIGCAISVICLTITIIFFLSLGKNLFVAVHYFVHLNLAISLLLGYVVFIFGIELGTSSKGGCIFVAALLQYFFLAAFCWMLCEGIMLYLMLVVVFSTLSKNWWFFLIIGWVPPIIPVVIGLAVRHNDYGVEDDDGNLQFCWLSTDKGIIWAFVGPMLVIILANVVFMVIALVKVFQATRSRASKSSNKSKLGDNLDLFKTLFKATLVLLPILGLTWLFGLLTVNRNLTAFAWLFTIFNSLQGVFILIFHVLRSEKVWQSSRAKLFREKASSTFRTTIRPSSTFRKTSYDASLIAKNQGGTVKTGKFTSTSEGTKLSEVGSSGWTSTTSERESSDQPGETRMDPEMGAVDEKHSKIETGESGQVSPDVNSEENT